MNGLAPSQHVTARRPPRAGSNQKAPPRSRTAALMFFAPRNGSARARALSRLTDPLELVSMRMSSGACSSTSGSHLSDLPRSVSLRTEPLSDRETPLMLAQEGSELRRSGACNAAMTIAAETMGVGVFSLPYACVTLGWIVGLTATALFASVGAYAGVILTHVRCRFCPHAESFADLAHDCVGTSFGRFTRVVILTQWALLLPYFVIACVAGMQTALPSAGLCFYQWALLAGACLFLPLQLQSLHSLSYAATLASAAMLAVMVLVLGGLGDWNRDERGGGPSSARMEVFGWEEAGRLGKGGASHSLWPPAFSEAGGPTAAALLDIAGSLCAVLFVFQGQSIYVEVMREMHRPEGFARACVLANVGMGVAYSAIVAVGYGLRGSAVTPFLPSSLPHGPSRQAIGWLTTIHIFVCYLIVGQPLHRALHGAVFPRDHEARAHMRRGAGEWQWCAVTLAVLALAIGVAVSVPFFVEFQSLLGALAGVPTLCGWPPLFLLCGSAKRAGDEPALSMVHRAACTVLLCVLTPCLLLAGTASAIFAIIHRWSAETVSGTDLGLWSSCRNASTGSLDRMRM